ncbi:MAG: carbohydrate ABC transporter permease [Actinoallomurus sp.]
MACGTERARRRATPVTTVLTYAGLGLLSVLFLVPFYIMLRNSLMTEDQVTSTKWSWLPSPVTLDNYRGLFNDPSLPFAHALENSAIIALVTAPVSTLFASMAGYALARIQVPFRGVVTAFIVGTLMIPASVTFVPTFLVVDALGGVNTRWGVIAPGLFNAFAVVLFRSFYLRFPQELEEAGRIDGLGHLGVYARIAVPNSLTMIASLGALSFIESWNAFLWPLVIGQDPSAWTGQIALSTFLTSQSINLPGLFAGAVVTIVPLALMFLVAQRFIVQGITATGLKD